MVRTSVRAAVLGAISIWVALSGQTPASAGESAPAVEVTTTKPAYGAGEPVSLTVIVRNTGEAACRLAALSDGTVQVTRLIRDGVPVTPVFAMTYFGDGYDNALRSRLTTVPPGDRVTFPIAMLGHAGRKRAGHAVAGRPAGPL
jgi:hypothetical protein